MSIPRSLLLLFLALMTASSLAPGQTPHYPSSVTQGPGGNVPNTSGDDVQKQQAQAANLQRQVEIKRDTEKMLQLTSELKDYLEKTGQGVMSMDAIKKAEQIEKLAHSVKSKMKQSI